MSEPPLVTSVAYTVHVHVGVILTYVIVYSVAFSLENTSNNLCCVTKISLVLSRGVGAGTAGPAVAGPKFVPKVHSTMAHTLMHNTWTQILTYLKKKSHTLCCL